MDSQIDSLDRRVGTLEKLHLWGMVVLIPAAVLVWLAYGKAKSAERGQIR